MNFCILICRRLCFYAVYPLLINVRNDIIYTAFLVQRGSHDINLSKGGYLSINSLNSCSPFRHLWWNDIRFSVDRLFCSNLDYQCYNLRIPPSFLTLASGMHLIINEKRSAHIVYDMHLSTSAFPEMAMSHPWWAKHQRWYGNIVYYSGLNFAGWITQYALVILLILQSWCLKQMYGYLLPSIDYDEWIFIITECIIMWSLSKQSY